MNSALIPEYMSACLLLLEERKDNRKKVNANGSIIATSFDRLSRLPIKTCGWKEREVLGHICVRIFSWMAWRITYPTLFFFPPSLVRDPIHTLSEVQTMMGPHTGGHPPNFCLFFQRAPIHFAPEYQVRAFA